MNPKAPLPRIKISTFYRLFDLKFGPYREDKNFPHIRISNYSTHSKCETCLSLNKFQKSCKKLEVLGLSHILNYEKITNLNRGSFCFLEELDFLNEYACRIAHNILKQLLFNGSSIQYLHLQRMDCLDDILWTQVISKNNLSSLVSLTLDQCHSISGEYIAGTSNSDQGF